MALPQIPFSPNFNNLKLPLVLTTHNNGIYVAVAARARTKRKRSCR